MERMERIKLHNVLSTPWYLSWLCGWNKSSVIIYNIPWLYVEDRSRFFNFLKMNVDTRLTETYYCRIIHRKVLEHVWFHWKLSSRKCTCICFSTTSDHSTACIYFDCCRPNGTLMTLSQQLSGRVRAEWSLTIILHDTEMAWTWYWEAFQ